MLCSVVVSAGDDDPVVVRSMKKELARTMKEFATQETPPYFLSYCITETQSRSMSATFGKLEGEQNAKETYSNTHFRNNLFLGRELRTATGALDDSAMASAGFGTDEDYGYYPEDY